MMRGDAAALAGMFTQDGVFNAPSGAVVKGREAIERALAGRMKAGWTRGNRHDERRRGSRQCRLGCG
jgi:hypothetical protein